MGWHNSAFKHFIEQCKFITICSVSDLKHKDTVGHWHVGFAHTTTKLS